jgi:lipoate-protein ligase A
MEVYTLTAHDLAAISALKESRYDTWDWNWGASPACDMTLSGRIEGCGKLAFQFRVKKGMIEDATLFGDFFSAGDPQALARCFIGYPATTEGFREAVAKVNVSCIVGLTRQALIDIVTK